jgi:hypothetical protein
VVRGQDEVPISGFSFLTSRYTLGHDDVGLAGAVGVGDYACDDVALLLVELVGVAFEVAYGGDVGPGVGVEVDAGEGGHIVGVVAAQGDGEAAALADLFIEVGDEGGADALAQVGGVNG